MITSASNPQIKKIVQLLKKAKARREEQVFVVEGVKMFREVPKDRLKKVYFSKTFSEKEEFETLLREKGLSADSPLAELVEDKVFKSLSDTVTPQGVLCLVKMKNYTLQEILGGVSGESPFFMILEDLQDPGNLGTILRTGEGAGITGVILSKSSVDVYNPKVIRSTMGSVYRVPVLYVESIEEVLPALRAAGVTTYAAHLKGKQSYDEEHYDKGTAFFIGNEGNGLTDSLTQRADCLIKIPMKGQVESLNAAMASGILMYEVLRQRK